MATPPRILTSIAPFLVVKGGAEAIEFYTAAYGAVVLEKYVMGNGKVGAKLAIADAIIYLGDEESEYDNLSPNTIGGSGVRIVLTTDDPDTLFNQAIAAGATQICPMTTEETWRIGKLKDPFGHIWEIGRELG